MATADPEMKRDFCQGNRDRMLRPPAAKNLPVDSPNCAAILIRHSPPSHPNPIALISLTVLAFGGFVLITRYRAGRVTSSQATSN